MREPISITGMGSVSPLGSVTEEVWSNYKTEAHHIEEKKISTHDVLISQISDSSKQKIDHLRASDPKYKMLDDTVLYAIYASRQAVRQAKWSNNKHFGINIGSSRGATALFEKYHTSFLKEGVSHTLSSPTTTLGNISSWVAHDLQTEGPEISHSITCSTALHSILNGIAWIQAGMSDQFLVGGSEAPLTAFTIAQMQALKIYSSRHNDAFPCLAMQLQKIRNTMVLGEGAAMLCLERGKKSNALAFISGYGYATEILKHNISISSNAHCFQKSMTMALQHSSVKDVDVVVMHAPGTIKGDLSEYNALKTVFKDELPLLTTNKWKIGHSFGASGALSLEMAVLMLQYNTFIGVPYLKYQNVPKTIRTIMVNAVGFGGNAVSILLSV